MRNLLTLAVVLVATAALGKDSSQLLSRITAATARRDGANVVVTATGTVPTGGWKNVRLVRVSERRFELRGDPPEGMVTQMITSHTVTLTIESATHDVEVAARQNAFNVRVTAP